jgi:hypothetical protein
MHSCMSRTILTLWGTSNAKKNIWILKRLVRLYLSSFFLFVIDLKNKFGDKAAFVAGGTDLFIQIMEIREYGAFFLQQLEAEHTG